jgi:hypothetical protein
MSKFVLHPEAYAWEYIAADSLEAADRVLNELHESIESLIRFPHQCHSRPELTSRAVLFQVVRDYVIALCTGRKATGSDRHSAWPPQSPRASSDTKSEKLRSAVPAL